MALWVVKGGRSGENEELRFTFGAFMTVCGVRRDDVANRVSGMLAGGAVAQSVAQKPDGREVGDDTAPLDFEELALNEVRQLVARRFAGHQLTSLVAARLEIEGYRTRQAPEGTDGGVDVLAGRGALGFDGPRLPVRGRSADTPGDRLPEVIRAELPLRRLWAVTGQD